MCHKRIYICVVPMARSTRAGGGCSTCVGVGRRHFPDAPQKTGTA